MKGEEGVCVCVSGGGVVEKTSIKSGSNSGGRSGSGGRSREVGGEVEVGG